MRANGRAGERAEIRRDERSSGPAGAPENGAAVERSSVVVVRLPGALRELVGGHEELDGSGRTVGAVLDDVLARHPALRRHLRTEGGALREHVNIYVNDDDVRWLEGEATELSPGDAVLVVPSIAGG